MFKTCALISAEERQAKAGVDCRSGESFKL